MFLHDYKFLFLKQWFKQLDLTLFNNFSILNKYFKNLYDWKIFSILLNIVNWSSLCLLTFFLFY